MRTMYVDVFVREWWREGGLSHCLACQITSRKGFLHSGILAVANQGSPSYTADWIARSVST